MCGPALQKRAGVCGARPLGLSPLAAAWAQLCTHWARGGPAPLEPVLHLFARRPVRTHARTGRKPKLVNSWESRLCTGKETAQVTNVLQAREDGDAWKSLPGSRLQQQLQGCGGRCRGTQPWCPAAACEGGSVPARPHPHGSERPPTPCQLTAEPTRSPGLRTPTPGPQRPLSIPGRGLHTPPAPPHAP